ncbi:NUDIX hydrolase (plasmid) [Streptomyces cynarae]|uniref:NUDIX hydrolase n=1 Tax=Streptomyces cynarae TaxID=2981134 RepID=A0ABY6EEM1_9ACTN|nr:NUDIX hydrolase [Streptomyces cynarae]UXY25077.1 NUDIX hydrolase [Streptomyces cynarae]
MERRGSWRRHGGHVLCETPHLSVRRDRVTRPDGQADTYDWVEAPDLVRVAALVESCLLVVEQYHYLIGMTWQLPGGDVAPEDLGPRAAAERELREETGYHGGCWTSHGALHPLPGLSPLRVHLWSAAGLSAGRPQGGDPGEADLKVHHVPLPEVVSAARDGRIACAVSAALVLAIAVEGTAGHRTVSKD